MRHDERGVIALLTMIFIGALVMSIGITAAFIGQTDVIVGGEIDNRNRAILLASACLDEAAFRLKLDSAYVGGTVPLGDDACTVSVAGSGTTRTLTASASSGVFTREVMATAALRQNAAANAHAWALGPWVEVDP